MDLSSELLAMVPCVLDFLDLDGMELLAATASVSSDINIDSSILAELLAKAATMTRDPETSENKDKVAAIDISHLSDDEFQQNYRMQRATYFKLLSVLKTHKKVNENDGQVLQVLITLHFLGSQKSLQEICEMFHMSELNVLNSINTTIDTLYHLMPYFITWPDGNGKERIKNGFKNMCKLSSVVGVIDSTHIECTGGNPMNSKFYVNSNGKHSIILQAVCDHEMRFLHCCTGWPGSLDYTSILHDSDLFQDIVDKYSVYFSEDLHVLGGKDYPLYHWLITPFENEKKTLSDSELQFNFYHSLALDTVSKAFLHLKRRFPRLVFLDMTNPVYLVKIVLVSCALHNLCINQGDDAVFAHTNIEEYQSSNSKVSVTDEEKFTTEEGLLKRHELLKHFHSN